jgi:hypothetical protein
MNSGQLIYQIKKVARAVGVVVAVEGIGAEAHVDEDKE